MLPDSRKEKTMKVRESETSASPSPGTKNVRYSSDRGRKRKNDLNISRLPLFRQGGATVGLTTRLSAKRDQGGSIVRRRFVEAVRETLIRRDVLGIL